jgi:integrase
MQGVGAFRWILSESCGQFSTPLGRGRSIAKPEDLVFANKRGGAVDRRNLLRRHLKPAVKKLGLPATVDFRSFRTMHSSLMSSVGVRPEVTRDNMGHSTVDVTQNVYNKTWWEERVEAVSMAAATVWREFMPTPKSA